MLQVCHHNTCLVFACVFVSGFASMVCVRAMVPESSVEPKVEEPLENGLDDERHDMSALSVGDITIDSVKDHLITSVSEDSRMSEVKTEKVELTSRTTETQSVVVKTTVISSSETTVVNSTSAGDMCCAGDSESCFLSLSSCAISLSIAQCVALSFTCDVCLSAILGEVYCSVSNLNSPTATQIGPTGICQKKGGGAKLCFDPPPPLLLSTEYLNHLFIQTNGLIGYQSWMLVDNFKFHTNRLLITNLHRKKATGKVGENGNGKEFKYLKNSVRKILNKVGNSKENLEKSGYLKLTKCLNHTKKHNISCLESYENNWV
uniref:Uncharacterized protein n=1 Tax=Timema monikensis TaxID=170555 RepID=A0A7R9E5P8_9NEOP|nr:unnamed protein product [Timema monikensis]